MKNYVTPRTLSECEFPTYSSELVEGKPSRLKGWLAFAFISGMALWSVVALSGV